MHSCQLTIICIIRLWWSVMVCSDGNTLCVTVMLCTLNVHNILYCDGL